MNKARLRGLNNKKIGMQPIEGGLGDRNNYFDIFQTGVVLHQLGKKYQTHFWWAVPTLLMQLIKAKNARSD